MADVGDAQFLERWRGILDRSKGGRFKGAVVTDYLQVTSISPQLAPPVSQVQVV